MRLSILLAALLLTACSTVNCTVSGSNNLVSIEQPKTISTTPSIKADGNSIPASIVP